MPPPADPLAAATHPDPTPYYARLVAERPLCQGEAGRYWTAASAEAVTLALRHPALHVRPPQEPVPAPLAGGAAGAVFGRLIRMTEGPAREAARRAAVAALEGLDAAHLRALAALGARETRPSALQDGAAVTAFLFAAPLRGVARLLGLAEEALAGAVRDARDFAAALSPLATPAEHAAGNLAAERLQVALAAARGGPLREALLRSAQREGVEPHTALANALGFLSQTCEATAGLLGNALLTLGRDPALLARVRAAPGLLAPLLEEVLRLDSPVQNTRRHAAEPLQLGAARLEAGACVVVLLAAANLDPAVNPEPHRFLLERSARRSFSFGVGAHACPGARLAQALAAPALARLLEVGLAPEQLARDFRYRPSLNARVPLFGAAGVRA